MAIYKNQAGQKIAVYVYDATTASGTDPGKTGDAANITGEIALDGGTSAATNDVNPTQLEATDHPGIYLFDLTQAETNADMISIKAKSATSNILSDPVVIYTTPGSNAGALAVLANVAHGGVAAVLTFERLVGVSTTTNTPAMALTGDGSAAGLKSSGGATGPGLETLGGATSGAGAIFAAQTEGHGIDASGVGVARHGLRSTGAGTGSGFYGLGGTTGHGLEVAGGGTSGDGIEATTTGGSAITGVVNVGLINSSTEAAVRLALMAAGGVPGTVDNSAFTPTTTVFEADDITEATADHYIGRVVMFTTGALADQVSTVTDYVKSGSNGKFTVDTLTEAPANDDTFILV